VVAQKLNRNYIGIELNSEYIKIAKNRINNIKISNY
jgi:DNA modification methylase